MNPSRTSHIKTNRQDSKLYSFRILVFGRSRQKNQEFKANLSYIVSLRPDWAMYNPVSN